MTGTLSTGNLSSNMNSECRPLKEWTRTNFKFKLPQNHDSEHDGAISLSESLPVSRPGGSARSPAGHRDRRRGGTRAGEAAAKT